MALEIERKFLVKHPPAGYEQFPHKEIIQGYFSDPSTGKNTRIRKIDGQYKLTKKKGHGMIRDEIEVDITPVEFNDLRKQVENHFLEKTRYYIPYEGVIIEFDVYKNLQGLKTAEVEFKTKRDAKKFIKPYRFGEDLTMMREATNSYIAKYGLSEEFLTMITA